VLPFGAPVCGRSTYPKENIVTIAFDQWPTVAQFAELTQTSPQTIRRRIADGTLEARRFGPRLIRINPKSLESFGTPLRFNDVA
jgi:excisionase family DNA binding protein